MEHYDKVCKLGQNCFCVARKSDGKLFLLRQYLSCRKDEAQLALRIHHPQFVECFDIFENEVRPLEEGITSSYIVKETAEPIADTSSNSTFYTVSEWMEGKNLRQVFQQRRQQLLHRTPSPPIELSDSSGLEHQNDEETTVEQTASATKDASYSVAKLKSPRMVAHEQPPPRELSVEVSPELHHESVYFPENEILYHFCLLFNALRHLRHLGLSHQSIKSKHLFFHNVAGLKLETRDLLYVPQPSPSEEADASSIDRNDDACNTMPPDRRPLIPSSDELSHMWALGCFLYEYLTLEPPFEDPSLVKHMNNFLQSRLKPIPPQYSSAVQHLLVGLLHPIGIYRWEEANVVQQPFLQPFFRFIEAREDLINTVVSELDGLETEMRAVWVDCERTVRAGLLGMHQQRLHLERQIQYHQEVKALEAAQDLLLLEESKAQLFLSFVLESREREIIQAKEEEEARLHHQFEAHLYHFLLHEVISLCQRVLLYGEAEEFKERVRLRRQEAAERLAAVLVSPSSRRTTVRPTTPAADAPCVEDQPAAAVHHPSPPHLAEAVTDCVMWDGDILFQRSDMKRPILHELMFRGELEAVKRCLITPSHLDFTRVDNRGRTPLHWVFCGSKTSAMLNILLDRFQTMHRNWDLVDWTIQDDQGLDFISLAAHFGALAEVWRILKKRRVRHFRRLKGLISIHRKMRLGDWVQLSTEDMKQFHLLNGVS